MISTCLSVCRQGWYGIPLFFLGIASLAFSQLVQETTVESLPPDQQVQFIGSKLKDLNSRLQNIDNIQSGEQFELKKRSATGNLNQLVSAYGSNDGKTRAIQKKLDSANQNWQTRSKEINQGISSVKSRLSEANLIFSDLKENFAGRLEEASPTLTVLQENLVRTESEVDALGSLSNNALTEAMREYSSVQAESNHLAIQAVPEVPSTTSPKVQYSPKARQVANVIKAKEAVSFGGSNRFAPSIQSSAGSVRGNRENPDSEESSVVINRLKSELAVSKSVQTELSVDTSDLQGDLRKAYREIVSLQNNLKDTQLIVEELEQTKNSLWQTGNGQYPTAQSVSGKIRSLERELQLAREDLRASRQTLLVEQERSNAMIRSVTNELERTRRDLDSARTAAVSSGTDSTRLASLERELNQARRSLQMAKMAPMDSTQETYLTLQKELKKALGEIVKMQIDLSEKDELEAQLVKLRNSIDNGNGSSNRVQSSEYVNSLLIDLNSAKREVEKVKSSNRQGAIDLIEKVASLENELKISTLELKKTNAEFQDTKEKIARREFQYATTIQRLEEDTQIAQSSLMDASLGQLPVIPFVDEMERNLAESEARIKVLSDRFETEQGKATDLIDGLQVELDSAIIRQKNALEQLSRKELDLGNKDVELTQSKEEARKLKEELEVVKVIAGQLEDLNTVLEETKQSQYSQSGSMDQVVESLRDELNQAKVELVMTIDEREKIQNDSSKRIKALELQLEDTRNQLFSEQGSLSDYTNDSKELVLDLKRELDETRAEVSRMKSAGLGESLETTTAVSQLQEALGTIRILQESLDESEQVNVEVDNLRIELADAMESQLTELQRLEDDKIALRQQTIDLESEIALLRDQGLGTGIQFQKSNTSLQEQLKVSQTNIADLEQRTANAEENGVFSLIELEEELEKEKLQNQELKQALTKTSFAKNKTVELLEGELANALQKLDALENNQKVRNANLTMIEQEFANTKKLVDSNTVSSQGDGREQLMLVSRLENQLIDAQYKLSQLESSASQPFDNDQGAQAIQGLEGELEEAEETIANLQEALESQNFKRSQLELKLNQALGRLNQLEEIASDVSGNVDGREVRDLKALLLEREKNQIALQQKLNNATTTIEDGESESAVSSYVLSEIQSLQKKLEIAERKLNTQGSGEPEDVLKLEDELSGAQKTIDELIAKTEFEEAARFEMESQLNTALKRLDGINKQTPDLNLADHTNSINEANNLKTLLKEKDLKMKVLEGELSKAVLEMTEKEAELEMIGSIKEEMAVLKKQLDNAERKVQSNQTLPAITQQSELFSNSERELLQNEIAQLNKKLTEAKAESNIGKSNENLNRLHEQLQMAVAESVEMQTELEETKAKLAQLEVNIPSSSQQPQLQKILSDAKNAEFQAESRIQNLTQSLRDSEDLRRQMELLLSEFQNNSQSKGTNYSDDPRFIEMQKELLLLQDDLLAVRDIDNPIINNLQKELQTSQNDSARLNQEFKGAMEDFVKIKEQMTVLESENNKLQNDIVGDGEDQSKQIVANYQNRLNELSNENTNLRNQLAEKDNRVSGLREQMAQAQLSAPGISPDNASLRSKIIRLEGMLESALDGAARSTQQSELSSSKVQSLNGKIAILEEKLRDSASVLRGLPSRIGALSGSNQATRPTIDYDGEEVARLREQVQQLKLAQATPNRNQFDRKIRDLNQKNLTAQIQLDQERARVEDYKRQLADAQQIKQGILERGQSANLKVSLLNEELEGAKNRITSLERTLIAARDAIRVLKKSPNASSMQVSVPKSNRFSALPTNTRNNNSVLFGPSLTPSSRTSIPPATRPYRPASTRSNYIPQSSFSSPGIQQIPKGDASLQLRVQVQFLNNKNRPAGFAEFFLVRDDLETILNKAGVRIPANQGINSGSELWARSVQRGYRYPGIASAIRNALATKSLARIKTNSIGESNLENIEPGNYFVIGSSPLGQVGVVWSKSVQLKPGTNGLSLDLRDAVWAE
jgi:chromosome segregation ATPase